MQKKFVENGCKKNNYFNTNQIINKYLIISVILMDTFSHIIIGFLLFAKYDLRLAVFAGFAAMLVDLDFILYPLSLKYPIFEHRGIAHAFPVVILYTSIAAIIFTYISSINFILVLCAGLVGSLGHITCDSLTSYGTYSLYPFVKKHVKLEMVLGIDPLTLILSIFSIGFFIYSYITFNVILFELIFQIAAYSFIAYFLIHCILKLIITIKFKTNSLPTFSRFIFRIIHTQNLKIKNKNYRILKWKSYNLITGKEGIEKSFKHLMNNPNPPLDNNEKRIAYSFHLKEVKRVFNRVDYLICEILGKDSNLNTNLFWYSLELDSGRFKMGANVCLQDDGKYKVKRVYPFMNKT